MKPGKILIVDDSKTNINYLTRLLRSEDHEIYSGDNKESTIQMISRIEFDVILLDIVMPGTDGYKLCELVRKSMYNASTPVIFITSKNDEKSILKGFELGGQDYVIRPFNNNELMARVNTHIKLKRNRAQLKALNEKLERTVSKRTHELKTALAKLKLSYKQLTIAQKESIGLEKAKEDFLKIINHEIRTPLNGIIGFQELIKKSLQDEKLINYMEMMQESVNRLEKFSMAALLITELKAGMYKMDIRMLNITILIKHILKQYLTKIHTENLTVCSEIQEACICTDESLFQYTFKNLLENAIYHSPRNHSIRILGEKMQGNYYQIQIHDNGQGFPPEIINNKFEPFINDEFTDNRLGLSLFTINLIMKYLKGTLQLTNYTAGGASVLLKIKSLPVLA